MSGPITTRPSREVDRTRPALADQPSLGHRHQKLLLLLGPNWQVLIPPMPTNPATSSTSGSSTPRSHHNYPSAPSNQSSSTSSHTMGHDRQLSTPSVASREMPVPLPTRPEPVTVKSSHATPLESPAAPRLLKVCGKCGLAVLGKYVRALGNLYHLDCFQCHDCGTNCVAKFFVLEITDPLTNLQFQVVLCEHDHFRRLDRLCYACDRLLRGLHIIASGKKYHFEHFTCTACSRIFEKDDDFYEHNGAVYCHYDYLSVHAKYCDGCHTAILKQFVEAYRCGRDERWHPECYMTHRYWGVLVQADAVGFPQKFPYPAPNLNTLNLDRNLLFDYERRVERLVLQCWDTLTRFEGAAAGAISDMLQYASSGNRLQGLQTTGQFILYVRYLFAAVDNLRAQEQPVEHLTHEERQNLPVLNREPRQLTSKILAYLAKLRETPLADVEGDLNKLLDVITVLAHNLKVVIRYALVLALMHNRVLHTTTATDRLLHTISRSEKPVLNVFRVLEVPADLTDRCMACERSIEVACVRHIERHWHQECLACASCGNAIGTPDLPAAVYNHQVNRVYCGNCRGKDNNTRPGFEPISQNQMLVQILRIAFARTRIFLDTDRRESIAALLLHDGSPMASPVMQQLEAEFKETVLDVKRLKLERESSRVLPLVRRTARQLSLLELARAAPDGGDADDDDDPAFLRTNSFAQLWTQLRAGSVLSAPAPARLKLVLNVEVEIARKRSNRHQQKKETGTWKQMLQTNEMLDNDVLLTLDDIPRIVAAEQAREIHPNAFKHRAMDKLLEDEPPQAVSHATARALVKYRLEMSQQQLHAMQLIAIEVLVRLAGDELPKMLKQDLVLLIPQPSVKKGANFWDRFKFGGGHKQLLEPLVVGAALDELTARYGVELLLGVGPKKLRIPLIVDELVTRLKGMEVLVEGIFRINGNIKRLRELLEAVNANPTKPANFGGELAIQLAAFLKRFLREMPDPLLTLALYDVWLWAFQRFTDPGPRFRAIQLVFFLLPQPNQDLLEVLLLFFKWVSLFDENSKMDIHNLATVLAPTILSQERGGASTAAMAYVVDQATSGDQYFYGIEIVNTMIRQHAELCLVPGDVWDLYNLGEFGLVPDASRKELAAKAEQVVKQHLDVLNRASSVEDAGQAPQQTAVRVQVADEHRGEKTQYESN